MTQFEKIFLDVIMTHSRLIFCDCYRMDDDKPKLPYGWVVKQSKSYPDRVYYFNVNTGSSSWEFPDLLQSYMVNTVLKYQ